MFINVDFPEPDGPITASSSPVCTLIEKSRSAATSASPEPYSLVTDSRRMSSSACLSATARSAETSAAPAGAPAGAECGPGSAARDRARDHGDDHDLAQLEPG